MGEVIMPLAPLIPFDNFAPLAPFAPFANFALLAPLAPFATFHNNYCANKKIVLIGNARTGKSITLGRALYFYGHNEYTPTNGANCYNFPKVEIWDCGGHWKGLNEIYLINADEIYIFTGILEDKNLPECNNRTLKQLLNMTKKYSGYPKPLIHIVDNDISRNKFIKHIRNLIS